MAMRLTGLGSQYLVSFMDATEEYFDGAKTYTVTLPPNVPEARFWSLTLYDNQTRSMLVTPQRFPRAGSQSYPSPAAEANADGTTTVHFAPEQPAGSPTATRSGRYPARGTSRSSGSTARSSRSSTSRGASARSSPRPDLRGTRPHLAPKALAPDVTR